MNSKSSLCVCLALVTFALVRGYSCKATFTVDRRSFVGSAVATAAAGLLVETTPTANAAPVSKVPLAPFEDVRNGFKIDVPADWVDSIRSLPDRRTIRFWSDPSDANTFVFIAYTPVRDDFTSLGSFGSVEVVAGQTILPKGPLAGVDIDAKMLSAISERNAYFFDYQQSVPNVQPMTHFRTIFSLQQGATGGAGSILVTITAQTPEERYQSDLQPVFDEIIASYAKIKA